ncbi:MAG: hypothetical protein GF410_15265 [Chitinivibrionales bacterium]|nr:hypothetical protein [Chitinivibrionales bacterium]
MRGTPDEGAADTWLFEQAQKVGAVFVTTDKDFYHTIPTRFTKHHGAIVIALRHPNGPAILAKFEAALRFIQTFDLQSNVILFTDNRLYTHGT